MFRLMHWLMLAFMVAVVILLVVSLRMEPGAAVPT
jgi:hypothetical protein